MRGRKGASPQGLGGSHVQHPMAGPKTRPPQDGAPLWQSLLSAAIDGGMRAVIDTGALLAAPSVGNKCARAALPRAAAQHSAEHAHCETARSSPSLALPARRDAAAFALEQLRGVPGFSGVTYYSAAGSASTLDNEGRDLPARASPVREADTLAIYDDARCRGADLKARGCAAACGRAAYRCALQRRAAALFVTANRVYPTCSRRSCVMTRWGSSRWALACARTSSCRVRPGGPAVITPMPRLLRNPPDWPRAPPCR